MARKEIDRQNRSIRNNVGRAIFALIAVILQVAYFAFLFSRPGRLYPWISSAAYVAGFLLVVSICARRRSAASKLLWTILILLWPVLGMVLYFTLGQPWATRQIRRKFRDIEGRTRDRLPSGKGCVEALRNAEPARAGAPHYLEKVCRFPLCANTQVEYHGDTAPALEALKAELKKAKSFIFMEYHAIEISSAWLEIEEILAERARHGVEVRVFYDDIGSAVFIDRNFIRRMEDRGIHCRVFNPIMPFINAFMNNRDHRKITVIDNSVAFTGGYNLADEYFNRKAVYGYWKDTGVVLRGEAVRTLTVLFLQMWNAMSREDMEDITRFTRLRCAYRPSDGYVQPYGDTPLDNERVGENVYLNLLKSAQRRAWITTPYLIPSDEMMRELVLAAGRGVDVRIVTPGIPDKKLVYRLTRASYPEAAAAGVRIYEYTPGFVHAKQMLIDDTDAVVGTLNIDYRSLYLHFENAVLLHGCAALGDIAATFEEIFAASRDVTESAKAKHPFHSRLTDNLLRILSPLL